MEWFGNRFLWEFYNHVSASRFFVFFFLFLLSLPFFFSRFLELLHSTSEEKNPDQRRTRTVSVQSTSPPSSPSEEGAELTADSLGAHRISSVFSHLRRQKKDRNPPPIDESLGIDGVSSDLSRLPPIRQLSRSSRRLVRRFSSSPTCDDSISPPGVSSSGRQCLQFGDQLLVSM